jgi:hypothetical protein
MLYQAPAGDFHDITSGANGGYSAGTGYDLVTGRGTPLANLVVGALAAQSQGGQSGPSIVTAAGASSNPVTGTSTNLSVAANGPAGAAALTYTWTVTSMPSGATTPTFNVNATNAAQNATATFYQAGSYTFQVTVTDSLNLSTTSSVNVTVNQTLTSVTVTPSSASVADGNSLQFSATAGDQFGNTLVAQPSFSWALAAGGLGTLSANGLYTAPISGGGTDTVQASAGGVTRSAAVSFSSTGPSVVTPASAAANPVTGTTTSLSVQGSDSAGASSLTYTWSVTGMPAGAATPSFSVNGTNAAQNTGVTFYQAGTYSFQVVITDPSNLTATSNVGVTVSPTLSGISLSPSSTNLNDGSTLQFSATGPDQFGKTLSVSCSWSASAGAIGSSGLYTAPVSGSGSATIQAAAGSITSSAAIAYGSTPAAPSNLLAIAVTSRQVKLTWTANGTNQTGFTIQRATGGAWSTIASVAATTTSYTDNTVSKRKTYSYRVYAYNSDGNSPNSNTATVSTPSSGVAPTSRLAAAPGSTASASTSLNLLAMPSLPDDLYWKRFALLSAHS